MSRRLLTRPSTVRAVFGDITAHARACPCHACASSVSRAAGRLVSGSAGGAHGQRYDNIWQMESATTRFGRGCVSEVGYDLEMMGATRVAVITDSTLARTPAVERAVSSLDARGVKFDLFEDVRCEPTDASLRQACDWAKAHGEHDAFLAIGGGSSIDTAKVVNLMTAHPEHDLFDFVNAPIGKGTPVPNALRPLIAVVTTAGTGSEATGTAIFDHLESQTKTGIGSRRLRPTLGLVDPDLIGTMPREVAIASGLDVLCHAIESYTAVPFDRRPPGKPASPVDRPAYQGANPLSDFWSLHALRIAASCFEASLDGDGDAREQMALAATCAGVGFGNAGVHLPHAMSYPISGLNKVLPHVRHMQPGYDVEWPLIPHGISVALPAPAVFRYTGPACPERHLACAAILGADVSRAKSDDGEYAGALLSEALVGLMKRIGLPLGLSHVGYKREDIGSLVAGTLPQERITKLAPCTANREALELMFEDAADIRGDVYCKA